MHVLCQKHNFDSDSDLVEKEVNDRFLLLEDVINQIYADEISLYNVFIPVFGVFIVFLNFIVVFYSGLILKTRKYK